jgi:hypothetical protein
MIIGRPVADGSRGDSSPATTAAAELRESLVTELEGALESSWYEEGNAVDRAVASLCRLRRAAAGDRAHPQAGDHSVREALAQISPDALVWVASRMVSYMDEHGFIEVAGGPEAVPPS